MADPLIVVGQCSKLYLYILGSVIFKFLDTVLMGYKKNNTILSIYGFVPVFYDFKLIKGICKYFGYILFGSIFFSFSKCQQNKNKENKENKENEIKKKESLKIVIHYKALTHSKKVYFQVLLFCFLVVFHSEVKKIIYAKGIKGFNIWTSDIIFMILLLNNSFKFSLFNHQKCSLLFIALTSTVLLIIASFLPSTGKNENSYDIATKKGHELLALLFFVLFILLSLIYSFSRVLGKVLMQLKLMSPYFLIIFVGVTGLILSIFNSIILFYLDNHDNIIDYFSILNGKVVNYEYYFEIIVVIPLYAFINFMELTYEILTVYYLNPLFILINNNLCYGVIQLLEFIFVNKNFFLHFLCVESAEIFALLGYSVYLEVIELNFCGFSNNLKRMISLRGELDFRSSIYDDSNSDDDSNGEDSSSIEMAEIKQSL